MTPQERKVIELALEALEGYESCIDAYYAGAVCPQIDKAITALEEALAKPEQEPATKEQIREAMIFNLPLYTTPPQLKEPEQEPVAEKVYDQEDDTAYIQYFIPHDLIPIGTKFYTTPPQRTWVGLTDEEARELWESTDSDDDWELMKRTEAKLKEKNTTP